MTTLQSGLAEDVHGGYSNTQINDDVALTIRNYSPMLPKRLWNDVADFTRSAVTDFGPSSRPEASAAMGSVARLAIWTVDVACLPLERRIVFDGRQIDSFMARGDIGANATTKRTRRLVLLRIAGELAAFDPVRRDAGKKPKTPPFAPYSAAQLVRFRSQGATRSTALRCHNWMVLLALGAGCALTTSEIIDLAVDDVLLGADSVSVNVRGDRARVVTCLAAWEGAIRELLVSPFAKESLFARDIRPTVPAHYVGRFMARAAKGAEQFTVERLRSTWIVGHLQAGIVPPVSLMRAVGVTSFSTFERLVPFVSAPAADELVRLFSRGSR